MSESSSLRPHVNGHTDVAPAILSPAPSSRLRSRAGKAQAAAKPRQASKPRRWSLRRKLAVAIGSVGVGVLGLSVVHCTEAIGLLTGSSVVLAGLMAIGIDAGMVGCELAELAAHGTRGEAKVTPWARSYLLVAVVLSCLLNAYAFGLHAADGMAWAAILLGVVVPALVLGLGKVAGHLWLSE